MSRAEPIAAVRGMPTVAGNDIPYWQRLERCVHDVCHRYACDEVRLPIIEYASLFKRSVGDTSDIVNKEMYLFEDRHGDALALRPEGTAGCMRAAIKLGLTQSKSRVWYLGPMFRYERPQKGRSRQFHQFGCEWLGYNAGLIDIEMIAMSRDILRELGVLPLCRLEINTLADIQTREAYADTLRAYFGPHKEQLDEINQQRLESNPMRILDSKQKDLQELIAAAPSIHDVIGDEERAQFDACCSALEAYGIDYVVNPRLVRGLDYYNGIVFEWITDALGSQGTVCAGGRYDQLVDQLGGQSTPALGYAFGLERMVELMKQEHEIAYEPVDVQVMVLDANAVDYSIEFVSELRTHLPNLKVYFEPQALSFKKQFKQADRLGSNYAVIIGADEHQQTGITWRNLRDRDGEQRTLPVDDALWATLKEDTDAS